MNKKNKKNLKNPRKLKNQKYIQKNKNHEILKILKEIEN